MSQNRFVRSEAVFRRKSRKLVSDVSWPIFSSDTEKVVGWLLMMGKQKVSHSQIWVYAEVRETCAGIVRKAAGK